MSDVIAADQLRLFVERIERLEAEKAGLMEDIRDVYAELKSNGYDVKTTRACVRLRKMEKHHRDEAEMLLDTYKAALGLDYSSTPLGEATVRRQASHTDVVKLAADIHGAGGRLVGDTLVMPMGGLKSRAEGVEDESRYQTALGLVVEHQKASASWLQRQMQLGYNVAARLVERLERERIVSAPDSKGARKVLVADLVRASTKSVMQQVADQVNAGALGPGVTATVN